VRSPAAAAFANVSAVGCCSGADVLQSAPAVEFLDFSPSLRVSEGSLSVFATSGGVVDPVVGFTNVLEVVGTFLSTARSLRIDIVSMNGTAVACPLVTMVGSVWTIVPPADAVAVFVTPVVAAAQAAHSGGLDLSQVVYPLACVVPPGQGSGLRNEAVLYRDNQRSVGFPLAYAPPLVASAAVSAVPLAETMTPGQMCAALPGFQPPVPVTGTGSLVSPRVLHVVARWLMCTTLTVYPSSPCRAPCPSQKLAAVSVPLTVQTVGTVMRLRGSNFGPAPVVYAGLSVTPAHVCSSSSDEVVFIVPAGEGSGGAGYSVHVVALDQTSQTATPLRVRYADPVVTSVTPNGPTIGGVRITVAGSNFGVSTPLVWLGTSRLSLATCASVLRLSHSALTCELPAGSGLRLSVFMSVADLPAAGLAQGALFSYDRPVVTQVRVCTWFPHPWHPSPFPNVASPC
jgi:hypothetical protein